MNSNCYYFSHTFLVFLSARQCWASCPARTLYLWTIGKCIKAEIIPLGFPVPQENGEWCKPESLKSKLQIIQLGSCSYFQLPGQHKRYYLANKQSCLKYNIPDFVQLLLWADVRNQTALSSCNPDLPIRISYIHLSYFWSSEAPGFPQHFWHARRSLLRTTSTGIGKSKIDGKTQVVCAVHTGHISPRVISPEPAQHAVKAHLYLFPHWLEPPVSFSTACAFPARLCKLKTDSTTCTETKGKKHLPTPFCAARDAGYCLTQAFTKRQKHKEKTSHDTFWSSIYTSGVSKARFRIRNVTASNNETIRLLLGPSCQKKRTNRQLRY